MTFSSRHFSFIYIHTNTWFYMSNITDIFFCKCKNLEMKSETLRYAENMHNRLVCKCFLGKKEQFLDFCFFFCYP